MFTKPYLMVFEDNIKGWQGHWLTGPEAANWIAIRSNPRRPAMNPKTHKGTIPDPMSLETEWVKGNLKEAKLYKLLIEGEYETLQCIYSSDSLSASQFCDGVLSMQDLLFDIEW